MHAKTGGKSDFIAKEHKCYSTTRKREILTTFPHSFSHIISSYFFSCFPTIYEIEIYTQLVWICWALRESWYL